MFSILLIPFLAAMFLAINMGASGTAPSFSAAYGAGLIRRERIAGVFGIFVLAGALIAGKKVAMTISRGILPEDVMGLTLTTIVLVSVALSLLMANLLRVPQSTSQATIAALVGPAVYYDVLKAHRLLFEVIPTWLLLPVASFFLTLAIGKLLYTPLNKRLTNGFSRVAGHPFLKIAVLAASCYVAFAIGSNNVANAAGPIVAMAMKSMGTTTEATALMIMIFATLLIAPCFAIGSSLMGGRVLETTGREIVEFGPLGAVLVAVVTATLLLVASVSRGIPTSLVQMNTAAIMALGVTKEGWRFVASRTSVRKLLVVWIVAPLMALGISFGLTALAETLGLMTP
ncbi:MAG: anion permease [Candidatus Eisenbacteria sp.]|nr:anion permease [Candidatus Eisenbacteria bacterium]